MKCGSCGSRNVNHLLNNVQCGDCGALTGYDGSTHEKGASQEVRDVIARHNEPGVPTLVGNLADLQRGGADVATGEGSFESGVVIPEGEAGIHPADEDAAQGGITQETIRTGIHTDDDLLPPDPTPNDGESVSVDPDSKSPVTVNDGSSAPKSGDAAAKKEAKAKADA